MRNNTDVKFDAMIRKIIKNQFKAPKEKVMPYTAAGFSFGGCFTGDIEGSRVIACHDCGFSNTLYSLGLELPLTMEEPTMDDLLTREYVDIRVCGRCNSSNVGVMPRKEAEKLKSKVVKAIKKYKEEEKKADVQEAKETIKEN